MDINSLLGTGALVGGAGTIVYGLFNSAKNLPTLGWKKVKQNFVYTVKIYQYDELFESFERWLQVNHRKKYRDVEAVSKKAVGASTPVLELEGVVYNPSSKEAINYKHEDNTFVIKYRGKRLMISKSKEKLEKATDMKEVFFRHYTISGWRAFHEIDSLLKEAVSLSKSEEATDTTQVYATQSWGEWSNAGRKSLKPLKNTILDPYTKEMIINDLNSFILSEKWYKDVCIPYKRGYCFYGPPGSGKTTLAMAIANYTKRDVYSLNMNCLKDDARLPSLFASMGDNSIILIEDIDRIFSGRENVDKESKISFSSLLNCLDGVFYRNGAIVIITTNHIEKLDPALLRSGRIDMKIHIPNPSDKEISEYFSLFYGDEIRIEGDFNLKMSDIQEICIQNRESPLKALKSVYCHEKIEA